MYNNPYMYAYPYMANNLARPAITKGLLGGLKGINWSGILSNTQKTLNVINQAIPIVYQVKPIMNNARTMFKIANTIKSEDNSSNSNTQPEQTEITKEKTTEEGKPVFFI